MNKNIKTQLTEAYAVIINHLKSQTFDFNALENFSGSAERCAKTILEFPSLGEIQEQVKHIISKSFPVSRKKSGNNSAGMLTQGPIHASSMCPHHLYPVIYEAWVAYIPKADGRVLGLSKFPRLVKALAKRPVLQEQLVVDIADVLFDGNETFDGIDSSGSAVSLIGLHSCVSCRGVEQMSVTALTEVRGCFWDATLEQKFQASISLARNAKNTF